MKRSDVLHSACCPSATMRARLLAEFAILWVSGSFSVSGAGVECVLLSVCIGFLGPRSLPGGLCSLESRHVAVPEL